MRILTTILAVFVLSTSIGAPFSKHTCFATEKTEYAFDLQDDCCGEIPVSDNKITITDCCEFYSTFIQIDFDAFSLIKTFSFIPPVEPLAYTIEIVNVNYTINFYPEEDDHAPPKSGRYLLSFIQSFLI